MLSEGHRTRSGGVQTASVSCQYRKYSAKSVVYDPQSQHLTKTAPFTDYVEGREDDISSVCGHQGMRSADDQSWPINASILAVCVNRGFDSRAVTHPTRCCD